jgi:hypothetical protein
VAERTFGIFNGPQYGYNSTTAPAKVATGTARKTMLQIQASPLSPSLRIVEWGIMFDSPSLVAPVLVELLETGNQGASGTNWQAAKMPYSTLGTAISSGSTTSFVLATGGGALFVPQYGGSAQSFLDALLLVAPVVATGVGASASLTGQSELVLATARSTDTLTVVRNADGRNALSSIPVGSPIVAVAGQLQADIVGDNLGQLYPPPSVVWQNCGWNNGSGANGTDFANVLENRYLAPPQSIEPIGGPQIQLPLGREPEVEPGNYARIVVTAPATVNCTCWIKWAE